jgi:hypothetical protein
VKNEGRAVVISQQCEIIHNSGWAQCVGPRPALTPAIASATLSVMICLTSIHHTHHHGPTGRGLVACARMVA